jgi:RNA polymerase sigma-70 factor, ECF subfamily
VSVLPFSPDASDALLLERVGRGDTRAYELIYERHHRSSQLLALRICGRQCVAEEVVQEAFLALWRNAGAYRETRGNVRTWIAAIVRNRAIDESRRHRRRGASETALEHVQEQLASSSLTDTEVERRERRHAVHGALRLLPAPQREAVVLSHFRGLSNSETAAVLGRPMGTVKGRIRLGHAKLRRELIEIAA